MNEKFFGSTLISACGTLPKNSFDLGGAMPKAKAKTALKPYQLRLTEDLYKAIEEIAEAEVRPVNSQMIVFLREAVMQWHAAQSQSIPPEQGE